MKENEFKTGQEVLVRDGDDRKWSYALYSHYCKGNTYYPYVTASNIEFHCCIPYKGNEHLVGTTDSPKEDDLPIDTPVMCRNIDNIWTLNYYAGNNRVYCNGKSKDNVSWMHENFIIPIDKFDFNNPENSLKYNIVK